MANKEILKQYAAKQLGEPGLYRIKPDRRRPAVTPEDFPHLERLSELAQECQKEQHDEIFDVFPPVPEKKQRVLDDHERDKYWYTVTDS